MIYETTSCHQRFLCSGVRCSAQHKGHRIGQFRSRAGVRHLRFSQHKFATCGTPYRLLSYCPWPALALLRYWRHCGNNLEHQSVRSIVQHVWPLKNRWLWKSVRSVLVIEFCSLSKDPGDCSVSRAAHALLNASHERKR